MVAPGPRAYYQAWHHINEEKQPAQALPVLAANQRCNFISMEMKLTQWLSAQRVLTGSVDTLLAADTVFDFPLSVDGEL